jgi:long-chain acyl-CoA synthetase
MATKMVSNLVEVLEQAVDQFGDRNLFGTKTGGSYRWITYRQFGEMVDHARGGLAELGVVKGDRVAIIANNRVEWAVTAYATFGLGACLSPMYEKQHIDDWRYIVSDCGAKVLVVSTTSIRDKCSVLLDECESLETIVRLDGGDEGDGWGALLLRGSEFPAAPLQPEPSDLAGFIYTSGTTGQPKGVLLTHGNFAHNVNAIREIFPIEAGDTSLSFLPWAHSFGQTCELHCMLANGGAIGLAESVATILRNLTEVRPTLLFSVPRIFNKIYDGVNKKVNKEGGFKKWMFEQALANSAARRDLADKGGASWWVDKKHGVFDQKIFSKIRDSFGGRLRYAFSGGAALSPAVATFIDNLGIMVYEGYGLSETSPVVCANAPGRRRIGSVGKAVPGCRVVIEPVPHILDPGVGEIIVYGPNVMTGYHNLPDETAAVFTEDGGFRTGDLGRLDKEGFLYITGRVKEQYKLENGKYVVPAPLEEQLKLSPYVNQVMIYGANRPYNVALVVPDEAALMEWAAINGKSKDLKVLLEDGEVRKLIEGQVAEYGKTFKGYEHPRRFKLIGEEFSTDNDMLTPKMSLKRRNVMKVYGELIETLY